MAIPNLKTQDTTSSPKQHDKPQSNSIQVALRIRPLTSRDKSQPRFSSIDESDILKVNDNSVSVAEKGQKPKPFTFDCIFGPTSTQEQIFNEVGSRLVERFLNGYNATVLAYGQTSSGKTYTMGTEKMCQSHDLGDEGIVPRAVSYLFEKLQAEETNRAIQSAASAIPAFGRKSSSSRLRPVSMIQHSPPASPSTEVRPKKFSVKVSFIEIYNEELIDLLNDAPPEARPAITVREDMKGQLVWSGVTEATASSVEQVMRYLEQGTQNRATGATDMNEKSSRSHAIFTVMLRQEKWVPQKPSSAVNSRASTIEPARPALGSRQSLNVRALIGQMEQKAVSTVSQEGETVVLQSKFHFVDLAGSERLKRTAAEGDRRKEGININAGLLALGNVISILGDPNRKKIVTHIPYRDSKLTRLLQDSLGGNSTTLMIACVSPAEHNVIETMNTIKYANRARNIKNKVERNSIEEWMQTDDVAVLRSIIAKLKKQNSPPSSAHSSSSTSASVDLVEASEALRVTDLEQQLEELKSELERVQHENKLAEKELQALRDVTTKEEIEKDKSRKRRSDQIHTLVKKRASLKPSEPIDFEHLVEPVIEEYELTVSKIENELSMARAALTVANERIEEQDSHVHELHSRFDEQEKDMFNIKTKLKRMSDTEQRNEAYIGELEGKLSKAAEDAAKDHELLDDLKNKITKLKEMDSATEQYIDELETRLTDAETERINIKLQLDRSEARSKQFATSSEGETASALLKELDERNTAYAKLEKEKDDLMQQLCDIQSSIHSSSRPQSSADGQWTPRASEEEFNLASEDTYNDMADPMTISNDTSMVALQKLHSELKVSHDQIVEDLTHKTELYAKALEEIQALKVSHTLVAPVTEIINDGNSLVAPELEHDKFVEDNAAEDSQRSISLPVNTESPSEDISEHLKETISRSEQDPSYDDLVEASNVQSAHLVELQQERDQLKQQVDELENKVQQLNGDIAHICEKEASLMAMHNTDLDDLRQTLTETQQELTATLEKLSTLDMSSQEYEREKEELLKHVENLKSKEQEVMVLQKNAEMQESIITELKENVRGHLEEIAIAATSLEGYKVLQDHHSALKAEYDQAVSKMRALESKHQLQLADRQKLQDAHDDAYSSIDILKQELNKLHESHAANTADLELSQATVEQLKRQMSEYEQGTQIALAARLEELEKVKLDLQNIKLVEEKQDAVIHGLEFQVEEMTDRANEMRKSLVEREQKIDTLESKLAVKVREVEVTRMEVETVRRDMKEIHNERRQLYLVISQMEGSLRRQDDKTDKTRENLEDLKRQYELQADDLETKRQSLESLESEKQELAKSLRSIIDRASANNEVAASLERQLETVNSELAEKNHLIEMYEIEIQAYKDEQNTLRDQVDALHKNMVSAEESAHKMEELESSLEAARESFIKIQAEHKEALSDLEDKRAHIDRVEGVNNVLKRTIEGLELQVSLGAGEEVDSAIQEKIKILNDSHRQSEKEMEERILRAVSDLDERKKLLKEQQIVIDEHVQSIDALMQQLEATKVSESKLSKELATLQARSKEQIVEELNISSRRRSNSDSNIDEHGARKLARDNSKLIKRIKELELEIDLEREKSLLESKTLQSQIIRLTSANDKLEIEMEQLIPQAPMSFVNKRSSIASNSSIATLSMMQTLAGGGKGSSRGELGQQHKLSSVPESLSARAVELMDDMDESNKRNSIISTISSSRGSILSSGSSLPPRSAPPSSALPPIPASLPAPPGGPPNAPLPARPMSPPMSLKRNGSENSSITGSITSTVIQSSISTADQFEKTVRALQRKLNVSENDVKAHQDVINKLEVQLTRAEAVARDSKKQLDSLAREKTTVSSELTTLRAEVSTLRIQMQSVEQVKTEERTTLQKQLEAERKYKERAERARVILENRMEELMNKKNKFMCF
ncbi:hypothetical protein BC943DRAFT_357507 [Umbelopsis sp. AD052]|nr:hypothetical protein BC943DRAFT_357507 [Umbelopsis sp. AD052]